MPPHVYSIAAQAYNGLVDSDTHESQSILISGESGAGKTEATKLVLSYLSEAAGSESGMIEQRILAANPILEAFGNAKTLRNNNSSRFGKFVQLHFDGRGKIVGCDTQHYLLEKTRIVQAGPKERSFHVFYHLCAGNAAFNDPDAFDTRGPSASVDIDAAAAGAGRTRGYSVLPKVAVGHSPKSIAAIAKQDKKNGCDWASTGLLGAADDYLYLQKSGCIEVDGVSDVDEMEDLCV